jgi:hypothetical protein
MRADIQNRPCGTLADLATSRTGVGALSKHHASGKNALYPP